MLKLTRKNENLPNAGMDKQKLIEWKDPPKNPTINSSK